MIIYHQANFKYFNTLKINTKLNFLFEIENLYEIKILLFLFNIFNLKYYIIGNGSKVVFKNNNVEEPVILISPLFNQLYEYNNALIVSAGYLLKDLIIKMAKNNQGGFESLYSIPASIGGAIYMNAANATCSISDFIIGVICLNNEGILKYYDKEQCQFAYRHSLFKQSHEIIVYALFKFIKKDYKEICFNIKKELIYRIKHQPNHIYTCGSLFKNPLPYKAHELIYALNKNYKVNDAQLSTAHLNFLENKALATGQDVFLLVEQIKKDVYEKFHIKLEEELNIF